MEDLSQLAIAAAMNGNWEKAVELNLAILKQEAENIGALNRLALAYAELGNTRKACESAKKVLRLHPDNPIAQRSLEKWVVVKNGRKGNTRVLSPKAFLEEPGKTKNVILINLSDAQTLLSLNCGDCLQLTVHPHSISVTLEDGQYIGRIPDDLSHRLRKLIAHGNQYSCLVKTANAREVKIFLREIKRSPQVAHIPSFTTEKIQYVAFIAPELVHNQKSSTSR